MKYLYCDLAGAIVKTNQEFPAGRCEVCKGDCEISPDSIVDVLSKDLEKTRLKDRG